MYSLLKNIIKIIKIIIIKIIIIYKFPTLFEASLRKNIDPFELFSDDEIWNALNQFDLVEYAYNLPKKLDEF